MRGRALGPLDVLNPQKIGIMIVLVAAVSFAGYVAARVTGSRRGLFLTGILGGFASSTAVTLTFSGRAKEQPGLMEVCAIAIVAACSTMFVRILLIVAAVDRPLLPMLALPLGAMAVAAGGLMVGAQVIGEGRRRLAAAWLAFVLAGFALAAWTGQARMADRLHPALEGEDIQFSGWVDGLPIRESRSLRFDFLPLALGEIRGFKTRFHLYTVPGQVFYDASRKLILKGVDGVVFVADSQVGRIEANQESVENLRTNLSEQGYNLDKLLYVMQYNKRDLPEIATVEELRELLNPANVPDFEGVARTGVGVFDTLKAVAKLVLTELKGQKKG